MVFSVKKYLWILHLFVIGVASFFLAQTVSTYIAMLVPASIDSGINVGDGKVQERVYADRSDYDVIIERNIFSSENLAPAETTGGEEEDVATMGEAVETTLGIKVMGILMVGDGMDARSSAAISATGRGSEEVYFVGGDKEFAPDTKLVRVLVDRIEFKNRSRLEFCKLQGLEENTIFRSAEEVHGEGQNVVKSTTSGGESEQADSGVEVGVKQEGENKFVVDQGEIDNALSNLDKLYTEIRIVPNFKGGRPAGMKILQVKPGSVFSKLGIKRGDILERINGTDLDIQRGMQLFGQLKDQKSFTIDISRRGKTYTNEYEIR